MIPSIRRLLSPYRRNPIARAIADVSRRYIRWAENCNFDIATNGERTLLSKLQGTDIRTVFDVGANIGDWAAQARTCFPDASIHCFEIVPTIAEELRRRIQGDKGIIVNAFGLGEAARDCIVNFFPDVTTLSSQLEYPHQIPSIKVTGQLRTGDGYLRDTGIHQVDFLKIDVEGVEGTVLEGFGQTIQEHRISIIQFEYGTANILARFLLRDAYDFLVQRGYVLGKVYPRGVEFRPYDFQAEDFVLSNYLAVLKNRPDLITLLS
jgi:FkbM family methyltransferase